MRFCLARVRGVPLTGEALGVGQSAHTGRAYTTEPTTVKGINPLGDAIYLTQTESKWFKESGYIRLRIWPSNSSPVLKPIW